MTTIFKNDYSKCVTKYKNSLYNLHLGENDAQLRSQYLSHKNDVFLNNV